jgi:outer membrane lipoprotein-sorting protein
MRVIIFTLLFFLAGTGLLFALTAEEIIKKVENNRVHETSKVEGKMIIEDRFGKRTSTFISYSRGEDEMLIEFTSAREAGQKILRTNNEIYLYYPDAEELIRMQGAALRQSVLGSDFSYEDMTGEKSLLETYEVRLLGNEVVEDRPCYKVQLEARTRDVAYPKEIIWVDKELFVGWKVHKFSLSGKLLKEMVVQEIEQVKGDYVPTHIKMVDTMKKSSGTEFIIEDIQVDIPLDPSLFSLEELTW